MLLSIGMIVKNGEKYLRDCLVSVQPILAQLDAELIICDTGSEDSTMSISKEFTNNVYKTDWQEDFSKARQETLARANGTWYMYVDADEIFEDVTDIIEFFKSGVHENYGMASVILKNATFGVDESNYPKKDTIRLYKLNANSRWVGNVYEYMENVTPPVKRLQSCVLHHGFFYECAEERQAKFEKNTQMLLKSRENDSNNARAILHLVYEHKADSRNKQALEYAKQGLAHENLDDFLFHCFSHNVVELNHILLNYEAAVDASRVYFESASSLRSNSWFIKYTEARSLQNLRRHDEAALAFEQTLKYWEQKESGELDDYILFFVETSNVTRDEIVQHITINLSYAGNFDAAMDWHTGKIADIFVLYVGNQITIGNPVGLSTLYAYAKQNPQMYEDAINAMEYIISSQAVKHAVAVSICEEHEDSGDDYFKLQNLRRLYQNLYLSEYLSAEKYLECFTTPTKPLSEIYGDVVFAALLFNVDVVPILDNMEIKNVDNFINKLVTTNTHVELTLVEYFRATGLDIDSIKALYLISALLQNVIFKELSQNKDNRIFLFETYVRLMHKYCVMVYNPDFYCESMVKDMPEHVGFVFYASAAFESKNSGDVLGYVQKLRSALKIFPPAINIISLLFEKLKK